MVRQENSVANASKRQGGDPGPLAGFLILWGNPFPGFCMLGVGVGGRRHPPSDLAQFPAVGTNEVINGKPFSILRNKTRYTVN